MVQYQLSRKVLDFSSFQAIHDFSWVVLSSPVLSQIFPEFTRATVPDICSLITVSAIQEVTSSLVSSCLKKARERRPLDCKPYRLAAYFVQFNSVTAFLDNSVKDEQSFDALKELTHYTQCYIWFPHSLFLYLSVVSIGFSRALCTFFLHTGVYSVCTSPFHLHQNRLLLFLHMDIM